MDVGRSQERVWSVLLPSEPQLRSELALLRNRIAETNDVSLVLDLSCVEVISSPSLGILLALHELLSRGGRRLILCKTRLATKCIFRMAGLQTVFDFADDKAQALHVLGRAPGSSAETLPQSRPEP